MSAPVYLDYNATTPIDPMVADVIEPYLRQHFGNPSSTHVYGRNAQLAVDKARTQVAALIGAQADEIIFTGCALPKPTIWPYEVYRGRCAPGGGT